MLMASTWRIASSPITPAPSPSLCLTADGPTTPAEGERDKVCVYRIQPSRRKLSGVVGGLSTDVTASHLIKPAFSWVSVQLRVEEDPASRGSVFPREAWRSARVLCLSGGRGGRFSGETFISCVSCLYPCFSFIFFFYQIRQTDAQGNN